MKPDHCRRHDGRESRQVEHERRPDPVPGVLPVSGIGLINYIIRLNSLINYVISLITKYVWMSRAPLIFGVGTSTLGDRNRRLNENSRQSLF